MKKLNIADVRPLIKMAIEEDLGRGDMTTELLFQDDTMAKSTIVSREEIVVCGIPVVEEILKQYDDRLSITAHVKDGQVAGEAQLAVAGDASAILRRLAELEM